MISIALDDIDGVPAIHAAPAKEAHRPLPTIFFFHGYRSSKELSSFFAYMFAQAGFRAILPEAVMHGERYNGDDTSRLACFWDILKKNIDELPFYKAHYEEQGLIKPGHIGVGGASMGGFAALGCMARYPWVRAVASYMGSGYFMDLSRQVFPPLRRFDANNRSEHWTRLEAIRSYDIEHQLDRIGDRPLFVWHGGRDDIVPVGECLRLCDDLERGGRGQNLELHVDLDAGHKITMQGAVQGVEFFVRHLAESGCKSPGISSLIEPPSR
jgi:uncharacterized protein